MIIAGPLRVNRFFSGSFLVHTLTSAYVLAGFFVIGVSAWRQLRNNETRLFDKSFRMALTFSFICALIVVGGGRLHGETVADIQPEKVAAMTSRWETASNVPMGLITWPGAAVVQYRSFSGGYGIGLIPVSGLHYVMQFGHNG